jgi:hypothetical protein
MLRNLLSALFLIVSLCLLGACGDDKPAPQPAVLNFWRPISNPNVFLSSWQAAQKLNFDLAQCKCSNYPINVPHQEMGALVPDQARLAETSAMRVDAGTGCATTPSAVLVECMRWRGWEPSACSGRLNTPGGTQCAVTIGNLPSYPSEYPYKGPMDETFGDTGTSPAESRNRYP